MTEAEALSAALRAQARAELMALDSTVQRLCVELDLNARLELGAPVAELRRLLHGHLAPPCDVKPLGNVRPIRALPPVPRITPDFYADAQGISRDGGEP